MLTAVETIFQALGIALFALGFITLFIPRHFRLGVIVMLLGDIAFASGVMFTRRIGRFFTDHGAGPDFMAGEHYAWGVIAAVLIYALCRGLSLLIYGRGKKDKKAAGNTPQAAQKNAPENAAIENAKPSDAGSSANLAANSAAEANSAGSQPLQPTDQAKRAAAPQAELADPSLFAAVRSLSGSQKQTGSSDIPRDSRP